MTLHAASLTVEVSTLGVTRHLSKVEESVSAVDTMPDERVELTELRAATRLYTLTALSIRG